MSNARIATQTARSCISQPSVWKRIAPAAGSGAFITAEPCRAIPSSPAHRRPSPSSGRAVPPRRDDGDGEQREADEADDDQARHAPSAGSSRSTSTQTTSSRAGKRSKSRCAKTVPSSVALVPGPCGRCRRRTATRASSPARAGKHRVAEQAHAEGREDVRERRLRVREGLADRQSPRERRGRARRRGSGRSRRRSSATRRSRTRGRRRPSPARATRSRPARARATRAPRRRAPTGCAGPPTTFMRQRCSGRARRRPRRPPRAGARCRPTSTARPRAARAAAPIAARRGSSARSAVTASASAAGSSGGTARAVSGVTTSRYPGMSEATTGRAQAKARVSTMPKLSPPSDGATSALAELSSRVSSSWERKPTTSIPSSETRSRVSSSRTASGSAPATRRRRPRAPVDLRPGPQEDVQPLARLLPAGERRRCGLGRLGRLAPG